MVKIETWMEDLPLDHLAVLLLVRERLVNREDIALLGSLSFPELLVRLRDLMRQEYIAIPKQTEASRCRWCSAEVYWLTGRNNKHARESIAVAGEDCWRPTGEHTGRGYSHLVDCPKSGLQWPAARRA